MEFWNLAAGMAEAEILSGDLLDSISRVSEAGIPIYEFEEVDGVTGRFRVGRKDYGKVKRLLEKKGDRVILIRRTGLYRWGRQLRRRPLLAAGMTLLLAITLFLPTRVLFIRVEGNRMIPSGRILEAAEDAGLRFGSIRRSIRSEQVKNRLLSAVPGLQWAGVNTAGCTAVIRVREAPLPAAETGMHGFSGIAASRDGVILEATAEEGNLLCRPGQAVREGELLISGYVDCGICIRVTQAKGEIFARTNRTVTAVVPADYDAISASAGKKRYYSLIVGKKRIKLWKYSRIWEGTCGRIYKQQYVVLPGGFRLPIALAWEDIIFPETVRESAGEESLLSLLRSESERCLLQQTIAGQILDRQEQSEHAEGCLRLTTRYSMREMIGRTLQEQIGEEHGTTG